MTTRSVEPDTSGSIPIGRGRACKPALSAALGAVALLELLARPAPARVVAADRLVGVHAALLDDRHRLLLGVALGHRTGGRAGGRGGERAGLCRADAAGVADVRAARR